MRAFLGSFLFVFIGSSVAFSEGFSKVVREEKSAINYAYINLGLAVILVMVVFFLFKKKYIYMSAGMDDLISPKKQSQELIATFDKMQKAIESRDIRLRGDYKKIKYISDMKTDLLVEVSHEIRSPMHAILNYVELGKEKSTRGDVDTVKSYLNNIEDSGNRLLTIVNSILDISAIESGQIELKIEKNSIYDCLNRALDDLGSLIKKKNIIVDVVSSDKDVVSHFDMVQMTIVFINIISNAIKFSPEKGKITVEIEQLNSFKIVNGACIKVSISDEGEGIPEDELKLIFDKYNQSSIAKTDSLGCGIGLSICKEIIDMHKGQIWAENNIEKGSKFCFVIPCKVG